MRTPKGLRITLKLGESARLTLPDGRQGWVYFNGMGRHYRQHANIIFEFPKDVRIARETEATERFGTDDRNPENREELKERFCHWGFPIDGKCQNEDCNEHRNS